jgi:hypothetical protein
MRWSKSLLAVALLGAVVLAMVGCGKAEEAATQSPTPASTTLAPPEGVPQGGRPSGMAIDWATAAAKLGVTEQQLRAALGDSSQGPPDFAAAAKQLGVSEQALMEALGFPQGAPPPSGFPPPSPTPAGEGG